MSIDIALGYYAPLIEVMVQKPVTEAAPLIHRYEPAMRLSSDKDLQKLRSSYGAELGIYPHPLYDLYFLQIQHAQAIGIAAPPLLQRVFVFMGQQAVGALSRWVGESDPQVPSMPAAERYYRHMAWFMQEFIADEMLNFALEGSLLSVS